MDTTDNQHVLITPAICDCDKQSDTPCNVCDGGLAICSRCGKGESELDEPCAVPSPLVAQPNAPLLPCPWCKAVPLGDWSIEQRDGSRGAMHITHEATCFLALLTSARSHACGNLREWNARADHEHHKPNWLWCERCQAWIETQHVCGAQYIDKGDHFELVRPAAPAIVDEARIDLIAIEARVEQVESDIEDFFPSEYRTLAIFSRDIPALIAEVKRLTLALSAQHEAARACPCLYIEPCDPRCTCVQPYSSRGCIRCCTYGSLEQRTTNAIRISAQHEAGYRKGIEDAKLLRADRSSPDIRVGGDGDGKNW